MAICKSPHQQLGISIGVGINICIVITKILVSAYKKIFWENTTFMANTPKYYSLYLVTSANLLF